MKSIRARLLHVLAAGVLVIACPVMAQENPQPPVSELPSSEPPRGEQALESRDDETASSHRESQITHVGSDATLSAGQTAGALVAVGGSAISDGEVSDAVVAIAGDARVRGSVAGDVVAVFGNVDVNSTVGGDTVAVFGNVTLGPDAKIQGDVVAVGGRLWRDPAATIAGSVEEVTFPAILGHLGGLRPWIQNALLYGRPLALDESVSWAWFLSIGLLAFYVALTVLFSRASERCVGTLETQPGHSLLAALLSVLLVPFVLLLLVISVIGIAAVPVLLLALLGLGLFGKATALAALGRRLVGRGESAFNHIAIATLVGGLLLLALYVIPLVGFIALTLSGLLGFGAVIYTLILSAKEPRDRPGAYASTALIPSQGPTVQTETATDAEPAFAGTPEASVTSLPRASFGLRMAALLIDVVLVAVIAGWTGALLVPLAIYGAIMWRLKGTTIGGIVFDLQVARIDGGPMDWTTAIVRALGCFLSIIALGLGFLWILFDDERQAWHDKIAGTVVYVRKGISLT